MTKKELGDRLRRLREPKFPTIPDLRRATGISYAQIQNAEEGLVFPRLDLLKKWLEACDTSLSKFFEQIEKQHGTHVEIEIVPGFEEYYQNLNRILRSGSRYYRQGIESNLKALATAAEEDPGSSKAEKGNLQPKEKKKRLERKAG